ncbi:hypothetical protein M501DRAFT_1005088 [Patellaria atrata CBS 101060]|uniref:Kinetochore protein n=1 Tax=Patellaria atrata CBS 101060 TaxID=1346257 RepID=A0A9P4SAK7_9PEZI|nr:hypothetical protein M501DRAFT_1005088 [Patellaria atrata CBS 101060]
MATNIDTVIALKSAFLRGQIRTLSQQLQVPERWREDSDELPAKMVREVVGEVNRRIRHHNKTVYFTPAIRQTAEQIDALYWKSGEPDLTVLESENANPDPTPEQPLREGEDLSLEVNIARIPATLEHLDAEGEEELVKLQTRLLELAERREAARRKLATYTHLQTLIAPLKNPQSSIQPNLVTRDGQLAAELAKLRNLSVRVAGRVPEWVEREKGRKGREGEEEEEGLDDDDIEIEDEDEKVRRIWEGM